MMSTHHYVVICRDCRGVISQCRCPSNGKTVVYEQCDKCKEAQAPEGYGHGV
jgi:hypothetical protein